MKRESILVLVMAVLLSACGLADAYSGGNGSAEIPYRIATAADMQEIGVNSGDWGSYFMMTDDINLIDYNETNFNIIGNASTNFTGVFDGNGHTISSFTYTSTGENTIGLFGYIKGNNCEVRNLHLVDVNIRILPVAALIGGLVGFNSGGTISNCSVSGFVSGTHEIGGLVGRSTSGTISDCHSSCTVNGDVESSGGLVAMSDHSTISNCYATGSVSGGYEVGGLVGYSYDSTISNCYATGSVSGGHEVGGLVGDDGGLISHCYATGPVTGGSHQVGGLVGHNNAILSNCFATGSVSGDSEVGGLVGESHYGTISNCYAIGSVSGDSNIGGLAGKIKNHSTVSNCYGAGSVDGNDLVGGLVGSHETGSYVKCFWDSDVNPDVNGIGDANDPNVIGKTTAEMQTETTFTDAGWDFVGESVNGPNDVWTINEGQDYPKLVWKLVNFVGWYEVDFVDYAFFANRWMDTNCADANNCQGTDLDFSGLIDTADLQIFCNYWLEGTEP